MADKAHTLTDEKLEQMEKRLSAIYSDAQKDIQKKADDYFDKFKKDDAKKRDLVKQGKLTDKEYQQWRQNKIMYGKRFTAMKEDIAKQLLNVNQTATAYINGELPEVYALNYNALADTVDGVGGYSFTLLDRDTVKHLATTDKSLLPFRELDPAKDIPWNMKAINSEVLQGIVQGESIPDMSKRIFGEIMKTTKTEGLTDKEMGALLKRNRDASIRSARTIVTGAENKGRMDSYQRAQDDGIILQKEWLSSDQPGRTRKWHLPHSFESLVVDIDKPFVNGMGKIMFPGDPSADGANVYNCRCSMASVVKGFKKAQVEKAMEEVEEITPKTMNQHFDVLETDQERVNFISKQLRVSEEQAQEYYTSVAQYGGMRYTQIRQASYTHAPQFNETIYAGKLTTTFNEMADNIESFIEKSPKWSGEIYRGINLPPETVKAFKSGDIIDMQGVSSWTSSFDIAESYSYKSNKTKQNQRVMFHSNGTKQGTSIKHLAHYDFEDEVLVSTKARWQIERAEEIDGTTHIFLKELEFE